MIDVFKVGVHIGMSTNATQVLSTMLSQLTGIHIAAGKLERSLGKIGQLAIGIGAVFAGWEVLKTIKPFIEAGDKIIEAQVKLRALGVPEMNISAATKTAQQMVVSVPGSVEDANIDLIRELRGVLKDTAEAQRGAVAVARMQQVLHRFGVNTDQAGSMQILKALDIKGSFIGADKELNVDALNQSVHMATVAMSLTNGLLTPATFYRFTRMAGPAANAMNTQEYLKDMAEAMMALGPTGGRGLQMAAKTFLGGQMSKAEVGELLHLGILKDDDISKDHGHYSIKTGHQMQGYQELLDKGFAQWFHDVVQPDLASKGFSGPAGVMQGLGALPVTVQRLFSFWATNWAQNQKFGGQYDKAMGVDQNKVFNDGSLIQNQLALEGAWKSFTEELGKDMVPVAIDALKKLTAAMQLMFQAVVDYPDAAAGVMKLGYGIAALTTLGGAIVIFNVTMGPFVAGIRLLVGMGPALGVAGAGLGSVAAGLTKILGPISAMAALIGIGVGSDAMIKHQQDEINKNNPYGPMGHNPFTKKFWFGSPSAAPETMPPKPEKHSMRMSEPMWVHVANAGDIGRGVTGGLADGMSRPSSGPSYQDYRYDTPTPGFAIG